ncbi:MAG: glycosyltransferase family 4 protein [Cyanobacteria bacterium J06639_18]
MNPLIISTFDISGGAARAAFRLHQGLREIDINSRMLVQYKSSNEENVIGAKNKLEKWFNQMRPTLNNFPLRYYPQRSNEVFSGQWLPETVGQKVKSLATDVINIHWVGGYLQIETIAKFKQPLVWTFHDMWGFTGGCHYTFECDRYKNNCGSCPQLNSSQNKDISRWIWKRKIRSWQKLNLTIVSPSKWLAQCARQSSLFQNYRIEVIPNGIDLKRYKPINRSFAREWLNLPQDKQLILFGAAFTNQKRKGIHLLYSALENLKQAGYCDQVELVIFGSSKPRNLSHLGFKYHYMGSLHDDIALALLYAAVDMFVAPSLQDNLPNTVIEALACGTPCVAFNIGGMPDSIEHQRNGYLAQPFDTEDFAAGIIWILSASSEDIVSLRSRSREKVEREFSLQLQAQRYSQLFTEVLGN